MQETVYQVRVKPETRSIVAVACVATVVMVLVLLLAGLSIPRSLLLGLVAGLGTAFSLLPLQATIRSDGEMLEVNYFRATFADRLSNFRAAASGKFLYKDDPLYALSKLHLGTRVLGFYVGWFRLKDGSTAYACVSRKRRARALTTRDNVKLILDPGMAQEIAKLIRDHQDRSDISVTN